MLKRVLFIIALIFYYLQSNAEKVWIPTSEENVFGDQPQYTIDNNGKISADKNYIIKPGDVIILQKGLRSFLYFKNIKGSKDNYITITNESDGLVEINYGLFHPEFTSSAFRLVECQYIKISGANAPGIKYGIKVSYSLWDQPTKNNKIVTAGGSHGISLDRTNETILTKDLTNHIEIENCEVTNVGAAAISAKIDDAGNGLEGEANKFVMRDLYIHDNYIHDIGMEGIYIGQSTSNPTWHSTINVKVYDNIIVRTGCEPMQIRNALDAVVNNNIFYQGSLLDASQYGSENNGYQIETGTRGQFYNNIIMDGKNEQLHVKNIDGATADPYNDLPEGSLINKMGSGIDFKNNYLDGGAETYTWDSPNDDSTDYLSPSAAIFCRSDYSGNETRTTNIEGNYIRNIYTGIHDPGKPKANLAFFNIYGEDKITYNISNNYFSGPNKMESHNTPPSNMQLGENHHMDLPEIEFVNPNYGKDNFCIVPDSYYDNKGINGNSIMRGIGYSKCIVPVLNVANPLITETGDMNLNYDLTIYKSNSYNSSPGKAVLVYQACDYCQKKIISDEQTINWTSSPLQLTGISKTLTPHDLNFGVGKVFVLIYSIDGTYTSNEINLGRQSLESLNQIISKNKSFHNNAPKSSVGPIVGTNITGSIQWETSNDGLYWSVIQGANTLNYLTTNDIDKTTHFRRQVNSAPSNVISISITNDIISYSPIGTEQYFSNSGDPAILTGDNDIINGSSVNSSDYQWQYSLNNIDYFDIPGATGQSYDPGLLTSTTYFRRNISGYIPSPYTTKVIINQLKINNRSEAIKCNTDSIELGYLAYGNYQSDNVFNLELSDQFGNFNSTPPIIGSKSSSVSGNIKFKIPTNLTNGNYKLRITSTLPATIGMESEVTNNFCLVSEITSRLEIEGINLYPNPYSVESILSIANNGEETIHISVANMQGQLIYEKDYQKNEIITFDSKLPVGVYCVSIIIGDKRKSLKFVKL